MLKKVSLTNVHTGRVLRNLVDTDTDEKALMGAGSASNETAEVSDITGIDERLQRLTGKKAGLEDRVALFSGLAKCFDRNLSAVKSFQLQANRVKSPRYRGAIGDVAFDISLGEKISDAMAKHTDLFPPEVLALIRAGEEAGELPEVCRRLANGQKQSLKIIKKLKAGAIYPAIVLTLAVGVVIVMSFTLVPAMAKLYTSLGSSIPLGTKILMKTSDVLLKQPWMVALPILGLVMLFKNWGKIAAMESAQILFVKLPGVGNIVRKAAAAVSFRCLAMLVEANVRLSTALKITADTSSHIYYKTFFTNVNKHISEGLTLPESFLMESHWLGEDGRNICGIMEIAGETGSGTELLTEVADDYEEDLDTIANQIDKILEPITILMLGSVVGLLIYAIYAPVFQLGDALFKK